MKNKKILSIMLMIVIFCLFNKVYAADNAFVNDSTNFGGCGNFEWCFSSMGIRISLYEYDNKVVYHGSVDYSAYDIRPLQGNAYYSPERAGIVAYKSAKKTLSALKSWKKGNIPEILKSTKNFPSYNNSEGNASSEALKKEISKYFAFNTNDAAQIKNKLLSEFGITDINLSKTYVTVEPTALFYKNSDKNNKRYYGTIYEFAQLYSQMGVTEFKFLISQYNAIKAANPSGKYENNGFLSSNSSDNPYILIIDENETLTGSTNKEKFSNQSNSNKGFGVGIFWMGEYAPATCSSTCSGYTGNALLNCASNYCENESDTSSQKEECVKSCGYEEVKPDRCESMSIPSSTTSICSEERDQTKKTCVEAKESTFYKIECSEKTTIKYSNDLPTVFQKGMGGFNYYVKTHGERKCTLTWDENYYNYKLAVTKNSLRFNVEAKKTRFDNFGKDSYNGANYSFKENDTVVLTVDGNSYSLKKTIDETTDVKYSSSSDGIKKNYSTTNEAMFELPLICYPLDSKASLLPGCNDIKKTNPNYYGFYNNNADSIVNTTYYGFYNNSTDSRVNTTTIATKEGSGLKDTNKCYYLNQDNTLDTDVNCYLDIEGTHDENGNYSSATVSYRVVNRSDNISIKECNFNNRNLNLNCSDSKTFNATSTNVKEENVNASITYIASNGEEITKQCPIKFNLKTGITPPSEIKKENNCPEKYEPSHYDAIRYYCKSSWKTDVNGYTSYTDCYNRCSSNGRKATCKTKYSCNDQTSINSYCKNHYLDDGYKSAEMCINDCSCSSEKGLEYIYRPISLGGDLSANKYNAFPNREAGTNWKGYEAMTIDNTFENSPQYIVELTADTIKKIKDTNNNKNKYIDYEGYNLNGYYKSYFIEDNKDIFICINKSGGGC